ncbi:hypothetical protein NIES2119_05865 [[Phormidium ambiguum] IAM M-71]|uniref:Uncharacterized protein n=1 Tax=[Phormidium ambiguum] IAM M-71 TaxID=454136 RepID=A0A1U7IQT4_9CYAN|nr:hypothetical protein [Phormidium ambiguum]OKH39770.1 hypothetical protein NIES2119_05865 [Phormidium ambiguum IAM M-71]
MQNYPKVSGPQQSLLLLAGTLVGVALTLMVITQLPIGHATMVSSIGLASLIVACAYISNPLYWWIGVGAIAGIIIGLGGIMAEHLAAEKEPIDLHLRLIMVVGQALAGFISGVLLGRRLPHAHLPTLKDFLSSLSAVTVGLFAVVVTGRFIIDGLEPARTLSSRLSASTTILITLLAMPGALGYLLSQRRQPSSNQ